MGPSDAVPTVADDLAEIDTCKGSLIHWIFRIPPPGKPCSVWRSVVVPFFASVAVCYCIPLAVAWHTLPSLSEPSGDMVEPFLADYNGMCMACISIPIILIFLLAERSLIPSSLASIKQEGVLQGPSSESVNLRSLWEKRYFWVNLAAQTIGLVVAVAYAHVQEMAWVDKELSGRVWQSTGDKLTVAGMLNARLCIAVLWFLVSVYAVRAVSTIVFLFSITRHRKFVPDVFHHDRCAGLKAMGQIGLRNQYVLLAEGFNILALVVTVLPLFTHPAPDDRGPPLSAMYAVMASTAIYLALGPIVFLGPLLPFRKAMRTARQEQEKALARGYKAKYVAILKHAEEGELAEADDKWLKRMDELGARIRRIPVWPFDTSTLQRFGSAYLSPIVLAALGAIGVALVDVLKRLLGI